MSRAGMMRPTLAERLDRAFAGAAEHLRHHWGARLLFTATIMGSLALIVWSVEVRLPLARGARAQLAHLRTLEAEVDSLKQALAGTRARLARLRHELPARAEGLEKVAVWLNRQAQALRSRGFDASWRIVGVKALGEDAQALFVRLEVRVPASRGWAAAMQGMQALAQAPWRVEVLGLRAVREGEAVATIVRLRIWMRPSEALQQLGRMKERD